MNHCYFFILISRFLNFESLPELMQGAAGAIITLQISFAIGILIELFKDKDEPTGGLRLREMLDEVWKFKQIIVTTLLTFFLPFFLSIPNLKFKAFIFIVWLIVFYFLTQPLYKLYEWVKGNGTNMRLAYLNKLGEKKSEIVSTELNFSGEVSDPNYRDIIESWKSLWRKKSDSRFEDKEYFNLFAEQINSLILGNTPRDLKLFEGLITTFTDNLINRDLVFLTVFEDFFPKILNWHHWVWREEYSKFASHQDDQKLVSEKDASYFDIEHSINNIIAFVTDKSLSAGFSFSYFKHLDEHISKHKDEIITGSNHQYIYLEHLPVYRDIFEKVSDSNSSYDIWNHYFPASWKITPQNFKSNLIARIWFKEFLDWAKSRIWQKTDSNWDKKLDEISKELFPSVDPSLWARILVFVLSPWSGSRMETIIKSERNFGFVGRIITGWGDEQTVEQKFLESRISEEETTELTLLLFGSIFTKENIEEYLKDLQILIYTPESKEQREKDFWMRFFGKIKDHYLKV